MHAMPVMLGVLAILAIAYRYYSAFLAAKVAALDDARVTPAHQFSDGQNFDPTNRWVLFGHHFAAISGAGPLIGPVLAIQFGYLPGLVWLVVGVCLAGAVQDMMVLAASTRRGGLSLASLARQEIGRPAGLAAAIAILYIVIIALAGLGIVVVKALGGEQVPMKAGTTLIARPDAEISSSMVAGGPKIYTISEGTTHQFGPGPDQTMVLHEPLTLVIPANSSLRGNADGSGLVLPEGASGWSRAARGARSRSPRRSRSRCWSAGTCTGSAGARWWRPRCSAPQWCWPRPSGGPGSPARRSSRSSCSRGMRPSSHWPATDSSRPSCPSGSCSARATTSRPSSRSGRSSC